MEVNADQYYKELPKSTISQASFELRSYSIRRLAALYVGHSVTRHI